MPLNLALHKGNSFSENSLGEKHMGNAPVLLELAHYIAEFEVVMPVYAMDVPSKRFPTILQRLQTNHVLCVLKSLLAVNIHNGNQVPKAVVLRHHNRLPNRSLITFGVAKQDKDPTSRPLPFSCQGRSNCKSQALPQ